MKMKLNVALRASSILLALSAGMAVTAGVAHADTWTAPNGQVFPYCTNSADNGGGFGWQPELGGPNGGSCKIWTGGNNNNNAGGSSNFPSGTWYDGSGLAYPICTNSGDNGGGFGWQPELGGPNGGSCKIAYNGATDNGANSNNSGNDNGYNRDNDNRGRRGNGGLIHVDLGANNGWGYGRGGYNGGRGGNGGLIHIDLGAGNGGWGRGRRLDVESSAVEGHDDEAAAE